MTVVFIILGFVAAGMAIGFVATSAAPVGFEDETGFHYGPEHGRSEEKYGYPVSQPQHA